MYGAPNTLFELPQAVHLVDSRRIAPEVERPHEILGLDALEADAIVIVDVARRKLAAIRGANGSDYAVRREVESLIVRARDQMLGRTIG